MRKRLITPSPQAGTLHDEGWLDLDRVSEVNMADGMQRDWRELCAAVTNESDSTKLSSMVQELIEALDKGEQSWRHTIRPPEAIATNREAA